MSNDDTITAPAITAPALHAEFPHTAEYEWEDPETGETVTLTYQHDFDPVDHDYNYEERQRRLEKNGVISFQWCWDDIISRIVDTADEERPEFPTPDEVRAMLRSLERNHDCNYGISWDTLDSEISDWKYERRTSNA